MVPYDVSNMVSVGDILARKYRVERILGTGGMGVVVAGRHIELNQLRAIKLMHAGALDDRRAVDRFIREAQAAVRLRSEHIAEVHDFGRLESGAPYIVMELLEGEDLSTMLKRMGQLPIASCIEYMMQACHALAEAHFAGIVHRDLKPGNLFLTRRSDGTPCIKVLDFGISKDLSANSTVEELTVSGVVMGTLQYMAPEQMRSAKKVDARADVYSLGAIMYKLLTGRAPFHSPQATEIIFMTLDEKTIIQPPSELRPDIPPELDALILRCLDRNPAKRCASAAELLVALRPFGPFAPAPGDDDERTIITESVGPPAALAATILLPNASRWVECIPSLRTSQRGVPSSRPSVLDYFPPHFYFRPPPVPEYVVGASWCASRPEFRTHSLPGSQETMPPMEMPTAWRNSAITHHPPKSAVVMPAAIRARASIAIAHIGIANILRQIKEHPRSLIGIAAAISVAFIFIVVAFFDSNRPSITIAPDAPTSMNSNDQPQSTFELIPLPLPITSAVFAPQEPRVPTPVAPAPPKLHTPQARKDEPAKRPAR